MNPLRLVFVLVAVLSAISTAVADPQLEKARADARIDKRVNIADELLLDSKQEKIFWPLYNGYQKDLQRLADKRIELIKDVQEKHKNLTDAQATELIRRALGLEEQQLGLKRRHAANLLEKLPPRLVARYLQLENKIQAEIDAQVAERVPLVE